MLGSDNIDTLLQLAPKTNRLDMEKKIGKKRQPRRILAITRNFVCLWNARIECWRHV